MLRSSRCDGAAQPRNGWVGSTGSCPPEAVLAGPTKTPIAEIPAAAHGSGALMVGESTQPLSQMSAPGQRPVACSGHSELIRSLSVPGGGDG